MNVQYDARDALKWLKLALHKCRPELVKIFLEVKLIEEADAGDERELRTNLVAGALRFAIREGESSAMQAVEGIACAKLVLRTEGSTDCVRLGDLRLMLDRIWSAATGGRESQVILLSDMFIELLGAYPDGDALEAYALTGPKPLVLYSLTSIFMIAFTSVSATTSAVASSPRATPTSRRRAALYMLLTR